MARNGGITSRFYVETNDMSSNIRPSKLLGQCKYKIQKQISYDDRFSFILKCKNGTCIAS